MTLDTIHSWRLLLATIVGVGGALIVLALAWARQPIALPLVPQYVATPAEHRPASQRMTLDPAQWQVVLWRPLRDPPPAAAEPPPPPPTPRVTLYCIIDRGGERVAGLAVDGGALVYLTAGQAHGDYTIQAIGEAAAEITFRGHPFQLELAR